MSATYICRECGEDVPLGSGCCGYRGRTEFDPNDAKHLSLTPIDVGFDLRRHDMTIALPVDVEAVRFVDSLGSVTFRRGSRDALATALRAAGYKVEVQS